MSEYYVLARKNEQAYKQVLYQRETSCRTGHPFSEKQKPLTMDAAKKLQELLVKRGYEAIIAEKAREDGFITTGAIDLDDILFKEEIAKLK
jgi:hypothetical protein